MNLMRTSIGSDVEPMDDLSKQSKVCSLKTLEGRKRSRPPDDACQAGRASPSVSAGFFGSAVAVSACRKAALLMICSPALEGSAPIPLLGLHASVNRSELSYEGLVEMSFFSYSHLTHIMVYHI
jgi:hypothetical protein